MQTLIIILFSLAVLSFILQISLIKHKVTHFSFYSAIAILLYLMYPHAIEQSYEKIRTVLTNQNTIGNLMVIQTIECLLGMLFSIFLIRLHYKERVKRIFKYFIYFPGIIIFPALFYAESTVFLNITGFNFVWLAISVSIIFPLFIYLFRAILLFAVPEYDLRLELKFILHVFQLIVSVIISIKLFKLPTSNTMSDFNFSQLFIFFTLLFLFGIIGMIKYHISMRKRLK